MLTTPHVGATLLMLHLKVRGGKLRRVGLAYITFPEMHRRLFLPRVMPQYPEATSGSHSPRIQGNIVL